MSTTAPHLIDVSALLTVDAVRRAGHGNRRATCDLSFDTLPKGATFLVAAGLHEALRAMESASPTPQDLSAVRAAGLVDDALIAELLGARLVLGIDAVDDGAVVFPREPIVTLEGTLVDVILAAPVFTRCLARATAVATRTARRGLAVSGAPIIDGSAARSDDADLVARAAYLGGANGTTAVHAGVRLGIPVRGTIDPALADLATSSDSSRDGWGASPAERLVFLDPLDDEIALLARHARAPLVGGYVVVDLDAPSELYCRAEIVALESSGSWEPRQARETGGGRRIAVRYVDEQDTPLADIVHLSGERIESPDSAIALGGPRGRTRVVAARSFPIAHAVMREGQRLSATPRLSELRDRALAARLCLPNELLRLESRATYLVGCSPRMAGA